MSGFSFDDLEDLDGDQGGGNAFDSLEDLDGGANDNAPPPGFKPYAGPAQIPAKDNREAGKAVWNRGGTGMDTAIGTAGGVMTGMGINPREAFRGAGNVAAAFGVGPGGEALGDRVGGRVQMAHESSPWGAGIGQAVGEGAVQAASGVGPLVGGALSGIGNTAGDLWEKGRGAVVGGAFGALAHGVTGKLSSLWGKGAEKATARAGEEGAMHSGLGADDFAKLDKLGGREKFIEGAQRLGLTGKPAVAAERAGASLEQSAAQRAEAEAMNAGTQIDPNAVAAGVRNANPYPGVPRMNRATAKAQQDVAAAGSDPAKLDIHRAYYGDSTNFAAGSPNAKLGKGIHTALNNETEDAFNLANPGSGSQWRQAGQDMNIAKELQPMFQGAADAAKARPWTPGEVATGGISRFMNNNQHAIKQGGAKLSALTQRGGEWGADIAQPFSGAFGGEMAGRDNAQPRETPDQVALNILHSPSQGAELGMFKAQFAQAAASPDTQAVQSLITRLSSTDADFRTNVLPRLARRY